MVLNYNHLYYFHVVAAEGSVAAAAARLGVTQPTVSEQIKTLEKALGVVLFIRQPSGLRLTDEGRVAFEHTTVMFRAGDNLRQALGYDRAATPQTLRIGLSSAVGRSTTAEFLLPLLALPECIPAIRSGDSAELVRDVRGTDLDVAIIESEPIAASRRGLDVMLLGKVTLEAVVLPTVMPATDWADLGILHYRAGSTLRWDVEGFLDAKGLRPRLVAEVDDALFLLEAATRGGYVAFVPRSVARDAIKSGRLRSLATMQALHAGIFAVYQDGSSAELARRAVAILVEHYAREVAV